MKTVPYFLEQLISEVAHNGTKRFTCPICRGANTLGISKENGKVKWHCFKAGCELTPSSTRYSRNISELKTHLNDPTTVNSEFRLPDYLIMGLASRKCVSMIINAHCLEPYKSGLFEVAYDPQQDRVCFLVKKNSKVIGLIGKACNSKTKPKVLNYPDSDISIPFVCGTSNTIVLVEDCLSAASVARVPELTGLALLGSSLKNDYVEVVKKYDKVIVALDRDARKKALAIKRKLCYYHSNVQLWLLNNDIKDMDNFDLEQSYNIFSGERIFIP